MTLSGHSKEAMCVHMHGKLCISVGEDKQLLINRINTYNNTRDLVFQMQLEDEAINETTKVAVYHVEACGLEKEIVYFALSFSSKVLRVFQLNNVDSKPAAIRILNIEGD